MNNGISSGTPHFMMSKKCCKRAQNVLYLNLQKEVLCLIKYAIIMKKMNKFINVNLIIAMLGIVIFWVAGFAGKMNLSFGGFLTAGGTAVLAGVGIILRSLRERQF